MAADKTTWSGRRIGFNERKQKDARNQRMKTGVANAIRWFKRRGWILFALLIVVSAVVWNQRFYLQRFNPLELRHLQYVEIDGNRMLSWEDVMQNAQIETGMLMSELDADSVAEALSQLPLIHAVSVEKKFPSSLYIKLQEASPMLSVLDGGKAIIYSERGVALPFSVATAMRLPVLETSSLDHVKQIARFLETMKSVDSRLYEKVSQISWSEEDKGIEVFFKDVGFSTLFPTSGWSKDLFVLYESLENGFSKDVRCAGVVDMRFHGFAYVRNYDKRCVNG